jgi:type VI protein secretion system component VasF
LCLWEESQKEEIFMFVLCLPQKILENLFLSLSLSLKRGAQNTRRRAPYQKQKHEKTIMNDKKEEEERERFFRATTTSSTTLKKEEEEKKYATRVFLLLLALLFALLFFFSRISRSTTSSDAATQGRPVAVTTMQEVEEEEFMRNLRYPSSTTTTEKKKKYHNSQYGKHSSVNLLVNTNSFFAPNIQKEKEEVKREGRKLLQFLAPVRYSLVPLSDAIQDLLEAMFDLSITPLQARIAPFLKFRETNVTDPKDPLVLDKEKVKEAIMKETLP